MAKKFYQVPLDTFDELLVEAGVLLNTFNPSNPAPPADENIITATTGGVNISAVPTFSDMAEDVDNVMNNMKEFKHLDGWTCTLGFTALNQSAKVIKLSLGCADIDANTSKITPRAELEQTDFSDVWWVGDKAGGGMVAVQLKDALSTAGWVVQTGKNAKGQTTVTLTGHVSLATQNEVPMVVYSTDA